MNPLSLKGEEPITVARDQTGLLRVKARTKADLLRGLGFCHAHDRGMQMLLLRVLSKGRAAELLAPDLLEIDRFFRRAAFSRGADSEVQKMTAIDLALVEAYCDGVNQVILSRPPWELRLLGYHPEPWAPVDSLALSRLIAYLSMAETQGSLERFLVEMIQAGLGKADLEELFPGLLGGLDVDLVRRVKLGERVVPPEVAWSVALPKAIASNNWVIAPRKTKDGMALLANDPHLDVNCVPAVWYECVLELPERYLMGAGMAGLPAILIGRNNDVAWGVTYSFLDGVDSWIEEVKDGRYRRDEPGGTVWKDFTVRREQVLRKKGAPVELTFYENEHGVLDGDPSQDGLYLTTAWASGTGTGARSVMAALAMLEVRTAREALDLMGTLETAWNWVAADREGHIGYQMSGRLPRRPDGVSGLAPLPGWDPANDWQGFAPATDLPRAFDPPEGYFVTANQDLSAYGRRLAQTCTMADWRAARIATRLAALDDWTIDSVRRLQLDLYSPQAETYLEILLPLLDDAPAAHLLRRWDRCCTLDSEAATLFEHFYRHLFECVIGERLGAAVGRHLHEETFLFADFYAAFDRILLAETSRWFGGRSRAEIYREAFAKAAAEPRRPWRDHQRVRMAHLLFGDKLPRWLGFDRGPLELPGSRATIHQGQIYRSGKRVQTFAPSFRLVADLGRRGVSSVLPGGPSDRRFSRWYHSELELWKAGRLKEVDI